MRMSESNRNLIAALNMLYPMCVDVKAFFSLLKRFSVSFEKSKVNLWNFVDCEMSKHLITTFHRRLFLIKNEKFMQRNCIQPLKFYNTFHEMNETYF